MPPRLADGCIRIRAGIGRLHAVAVTTATRSDAPPDVQADIANLQSAMAAAGVEEGFMCSIAPGNVARGEDLYYRTEEEFVFAASEAMGEEY